MQLVHLASRLYGTPLLIARPKLDVILSVLGSRIGLPEAGAAVPFPASRAAPTPEMVAERCRGTAQMGVWGWQGPAGTRCQARSGNCSPVSSELSVRCPPGLAQSLCAFFGASIFEDNESAPGCVAADLAGIAEMAWAKPENLNRFVPA